MAIWEHPQHDVVSGCVMNEGSFWVNEEDIWHPDLLHQPPIESHAFVSMTGKGEALILPVMPQVQGHRKVLQREEDKGEIMCLVVICSTHVKKWVEWMRRKSKWCIHCWGTESLFVFSSIPEDWNAFLVLLTCLPVYEHITHIAASLFKVKPIMISLSVVIS